MELTITRPDALDPVSAASVRALADRIEAEDGAPPLSDQARAQLASPSVAHALASSPAGIVGYAQLADGVLEIVGGRDALAPLLDALERRDVEVWSHGRRSRLVDVLSARGFDRVRVLHQLRRPGDLAVPDRPLPDGVTVQPFVVGRDEDDWLRVNAAAFAHHPEQGRWTRADVAAREAEAWFDPAGFLLARRGDELLGFHWTKVHPDGLGEVYVLGVDPSTQGTGLGAALLVLGLRWLHERGCPGVLLYVDESNGAAMALYEKYGFTRYDEDVQWTGRPVR